MIAVQKSSIDELKAAGQAALASQLQNAWRRYQNTVLAAKVDGDLRDALWRDALAIESMGRFNGEYGVQPGVLRDGSGNAYSFGQFATNQIMSTFSRRVPTDEADETTPATEVRFGQLEADLLTVLAEVRAYWEAA